jgi:putative oxidoreductase
MSLRALLFNGTSAGPATSFGLLILRLVFGATMFRIGWNKFVQRDAMLARWSDPTGLLGNTASFWLLLFAEVACAVFIAVGLATRLATIPLVIAMSVAAFIAHAGDPWVSATGGAAKMPALLFLGAFAALLFAGAGRYSLDAALAPRSSR